MTAPGRNGAPGRIAASRLGRQESDAGRPASMSLEAIGAVQVGDDIAVAVEQRLLLEAGAELFGGDVAHTLLVRIAVVVRHGGVHGDSGERGGADAGAARAAARAAAGSRAGRAGRPLGEGRRGVENRERDESNESN